MCKFAVKLCNISSLSSCFSSSSSSNGHHILYARVNYLSLSVYTIWCSDNLAHTHTFIHAHIHLKSSLNHSRSAPFFVLFRGEADLWSVLSDSRGPVATTADPVDGQQEQQARAEPGQDEITPQRVATLDRRRMFAWKER